jgi:hypothetical protein
LQEPLAGDPRADGLKNAKPVATLVMSSGRRLDLFSAVQIEIQPKKKEAKLESMRETVVNGTKPGVARTVELIATVPFQVHASVPQTFKTETPPGEGRAFFWFRRFGYGVRLGPAMSRCSTISGWVLGEDNMMGLLSLVNVLMGLQSSGSECSPCHHFFRLGILSQC